MPNPEDRVPEDRVSKPKKIVPEDREPNPDLEDRIPKANPGTDH